MPYRDDSYMIDDQDAKDWAAEIDAKNLQESKNKRITVIRIPQNSMQK